jgi:hypothetical protein
MMKVLFILKFFSYLQDGWSLRGQDGAFHHYRKIIKYASKTFRNGDTVGLLLNMDNFTLKYFINSKKVLMFSNPKWKVCVMRWIPVNIIRDRQFIQALPRSHVMMR